MSSTTTPRGRKRLSTTPTVNKTKQEDAVSSRLAQTPQRTPRVRKYGVRTIDETPSNSEQEEDQELNRLQNKENINASSNISQATPKSLRSNDFSTPLATLVSPIF